LSYGDDYAQLAPFLRGLAGVPEFVADDPYTRRTLPAAAMAAMRSAMKSSTVPEAPAVDQLPEWRQYDELLHLEHDLDGRLVGEFSLLEVLEKAAGAHADWTKRSARSLMNALQKRAADLVNREE